MKEAMGSDESPIILTLLPLPLSPFILPFPPGYRLVLVINKFKHLKDEKWQHILVYRADIYTFTDWIDLCKVTGSLRS